MPDLEKIGKQVLKGSVIEDVVKKFDWKDFEKVVADIFRKNDFGVKNNFRFKTNRRYEADIVAIKFNVIFCADCKRWSEGRDKTWSLVKAAREQKKRTDELEKFVKKNPIAKGLMKIRNANFVPMVVTLHQENILKESRTFVLPVSKLNTFLLNYETML